MFQKIVRLSPALACGLVLASSLPLRAGQGADLITNLPREAFQRCGLAKLTPDELATLKAELDAALAPAVPEKSPATESVPRGEAAFGREQEVQEKVAREREIPDSIRSRIAGEFRGWSGNTVFQLENGQVWRQAGSGSAFLRLDSPEVTIERGALGAFFLRVEGIGGRVKVKRIR
ncbi:MAG: hypothetical protein QM691_09590 [Opitutaceae bacterium]